MYIYYSFTKFIETVDSKKQLIISAKEVIENAYAPYSNFRVGSAILSKSGKIYTGCNVENVSFTPTICAERAAIFKAISEGEQEFTEIVVACEDRLPTPPCGVCLQVLSEFAGPEFIIIMVTVSGEEIIKTLGEMLSNPFTPQRSIGHQQLE